MTIDELFSKDGPIMRAIQRADDHGIDVSLHIMSKQTVVSVDGDVAHIQDLPKLVEAAIKRIRGNAK